MKRKGCEFVWEVKSMDETKITLKDPDEEFSKTLLCRPREPVSVDTAEVVMKAILKLSPYKRPRVMPPCGICDASLKTWGATIVEGVARAAIRAA